MSNFPLVLSLVLVVVVPIVLVRAHAANDDDLLDDWARARGLELASDNRPIVARYLRRARLLRTWGVLVGILLPTFVELALHGRLVVLGFGPNDSAPFAGPMEAYIGYLVGALCAEVSLARPRDPARRSASLVRRELEDYLPRRLLWAQRGLGVAAVLGVMAIGLVPFPSSVTDPSWPALVGAAAFFGAFAVAVEALERWIVRRPQPFTSPSLVAADDAIRAQSVHALAGSGVAFLLLACSGVFAVLPASDVALLRWMWLPALATFVLSARACLGISQQPWRVHRGVGRSAGAAPA
jgi:hypothetical protein